MSPAFVVIPVCVSFRQACDDYLFVFNLFAFFEWSVGGSVEFYTIDILKEYSCGLCVRLLSFVITKVYAINLWDRCYFIFVVFFYNCCCDQSID